jgi:hypothetical protein
MAPEPLLSPTGPRLHLEPVASCEWALSGQAGAGQWHFHHDNLIGSHGLVLQPLLGLVPYGADVRPEALFQGLVVALLWMTMVADAQTPAKASEVRATGKRPKLVLPASWRHPFCRDVILQLTSRLGERRSLWAGQRQRVGERNVTCW